MRAAAAGALLAALLLAGCAPVLVGSYDDYNPEGAYIYGRFLLKTDGHQAMAFSIRCRDGKRYKIVFSQNYPLQMIRVRAGMCQLDDVIYKGWNSAREMASFRLLGNEHLQPGGVYYVGDFVATGTSHAAASGVDLEHGPHSRVYQRWELFTPTDNYAATTADMKQIFPRFTTVVTEDRMARQ